MKIYMVLDCLDYGDGVSGDVRTKVQMARELGYECEIYSLICDPRLKDICKDINSLKADKDDIIFHHYSGESKIVKKVLSQPCTKVMVYHNITPPTFMEGITKEFCRNGLKQLEELSDKYDYYLGDSNYNTSDLKKAGVKANPEVLPIVVDFGERQVEKAERSIKETQFLFVGRVAPNKKFEDIINVFNYYYEFIDHRAKLVFVGNTELFPDYYHSLQEKAEALPCKKNVFFMGKVSDDEKNEIFQESTVYLSMSEHEGFGIPLLEAMWYGIPVFAYDAAAVKETMGDSGIVFNDKNPIAVARIIENVVKDNKLRNNIIEKQLHNLEKYRYSSIKNQFNNYINCIKEHLPFGQERDVSEKKLRIQMQGPFETSYSLAIVNRKLIEAMHTYGLADVSIHCTEGPGDYWPSDEDLKDKPLAKYLWTREASFGIPDVAIRNMYPPVTTGLTAQMNFQAFGWEEDRIPAEYIADFNKDLDGIGTMSNFVTQALLDSGLTIPVKTMGIGVELPDNYNEIKPYPLKTNKKFKFLHISSAFPRKGVDVLLKAYFEKFTADDDVCLVLKTFPNIHNETDKQLSELRKKYKNAPEVEWINCDLQSDLLYGLYKTANCYVQSARGEGFGLPVAEAMLAKIPTIVCNNSGMADFCTTDTCIPVGFTKTHAQSHVAETFNWFEPDLEELERNMYDIVYNPDKWSLQTIIENAYKLISGQYTWEMVAKRWMDFINNVRNNQKKFNVDLITTWNTRCGIAEFTRKMVENTDMHVNYQIYPNISEECITEDETFVKKRTWIIDKKGCKPLISELEKSNSDIIHIQYNFGFFPVTDLAMIVERFAFEKRVIIHFHGTDDYLKRLPQSQRSKTTEILNRAYAFIVHQESDVKNLISYGFDKSKIKLIPHMQYLFIKRSIVNCRNILGISSKHVIGSYGFLLPHKGIRKVIGAVSLLKKRYPDVLYIASCAFYDEANSRNYYEECINDIKEYGLEDNVLLVTDFLAPEESMILLQACDALVMPYDPTVESASGAVRFCLAAERVLVTTRQPIFQDVADTAYQIEDNDPVKIARAFEELFENQDNSRYIAKNITKNSAHNITKQIMELYR